MTTTSLVSMGKPPSGAPTNWRFISSVLSLAATAACLVACGGDDSGKEPSDAGKAACAELSSTCHGDEAEGTIAECHDIGHRADPEQCLARYEECKAACTSEAPGHGGHGGQGGDSH